MSLLACVVLMAVTGVQTYPAPPLAEPSDRFEASAGGHALLVERFHDVSYARFALGGSAPIEIHFKSKVRSARAVPASAVEGLSSEGQVSASPSGGRRTSRCW